jgi:hypothetical protein
MNRHDDRNRHRDLRDDRRGYDRRPPTRKGQPAKVLWILGIVAVTGLVVSRGGCDATPSAHTLPPKKALASLKPKDLQQQTAEYGIEGGAAAAMKVVNAGKAAEPHPLDTPDPEVRVTNGGFVVLKVRSSNPHVLPRDRELATQEAVAEARRVLIEQGKAPPGEWPVSFDPEKVRDVPPDEGVKKKWEESGLADRGWVEIDAVTLSHDTLRQERAKERTAQAGFWFGTAFLGLLAAYGFLRLDMWTKGYLTLALGVFVGGFVVAAIIALGLLIW